MPKEGVSKYNHTEVAHLFNQGLSTQQIASKLGSCYQYVNEMLNKQGIIVSRKDVRRKYFFNDDTFRNIDTEQKAYWLGFIYADGCIVEMQIENKRKYFSMGLAIKDKYHLERFRKFLDYKGEIILKKNGCYYLIINHKSFVDNLMTQGVTPRKSLTIPFPNLKQVPANLIGHFMRGYFDGDGCVMYRRKSLTVMICSSMQFSIGAAVNFPMIKVRTEGKIHRLFIYSIKGIADFYSMIYKDATIFLERKKNIFDKYYLERGSTTIISNPVI